MTNLEFLELKQILLSIHSGIELLLTLVTVGVGLQAIRLFSTIKK